MTHKRKALGAFGEDIAAAYLVEQGCEIWQRNWRCEFGEVDIVAIDSGELVICEVKTRRSTRFGHPVEAVTHKKLTTLRRLAAHWLRVREAESGESKGFSKVRIDVVGVLIEPGTRPQLTHLKAVG